MPDFASESEKAIHDFNVEQGFINDDTTQIKTNTLKSNKLVLAFLNNFKFIIFFIGGAILIGTFMSEELLDWYLILILAGMVIVNKDLVLSIKV
jgi:hypothetical protein